MIEKNPVKWMSTLDTLFSESERFIVRLSVCRLSVCNVRAPYSGD